MSNVPNERMGEMNDRNKERAIKTCLRKRRYEKQSQAEYAAHGRNQEHKNSKFHKIIAYACDVCGGWHLAHQISKYERSQS